MNHVIPIDGIDVTCVSSINELITTSIIVKDKVVPGMAIAINPEKIMAARSDCSVRHVIKEATLRYPDGFGVSYVMSKKSGREVARIPGCELWEHVMVKSSSNEIPVYLVGASETVIQETKYKLLESGVNVVGCQNGYFDSHNETDIIENIVASGAKIVTVALGSPRQELFIFKCREHMPESFFMGVGGTYDVYTGNVTRAPKIFQKLNLEWLYRLMSQPTRIGRQVSLLKYFLLHIRKRL